MKYYPIVVREARYFFGINAPVHYFMGQIEQESSCRERVVASDGGMGLAQFMPQTAKWIHMKEVALREFGINPQPFNPRWAIRAMILYNRFCYENVLCKGYYFMFRAYNGGIENLNKEIRLAKSCEPAIVEKFCRRGDNFCEINIAYPYLIFKRAEKYRR